MFDVGTGDKRAIITPKQKASLIFPQLVLDNEHREGSSKPRTKALKNVKGFDFQQILTVEKSIFCDFLPIYVVRVFVCMGVRMSVRLAVNYKVSEGVLPSAKNYFSTT